MPLGPAVSIYFVACLPRSDQHHGTLIEYLYIFNIMFHSTWGGFFLPLHWCSLSHCCGLNSDTIELLSYRPLPPLPSVIT